MEGQPAAFSHNVYHQPQKPPLHYVKSTVEGPQDQYNTNENVPQQQQPNYFNQQQNPYNPYAISNNHPISPKYAINPMNPYYSGQLTPINNSYPKSMVKLKRKPIPKPKPLPNTVELQVQNTPQSDNVEKTLHKNVTKNRNSGCFGCCTYGCCRKWSDNILLDCLNCCHCKKDELTKKPEKLDMKDERVQDVIYSNCDDYFKTSFINLTLWFEYSAKNLGPGIIFGIVMIPLCFIGDVFNILLNLTCLPLVFLCHPIWCCCGCCKDEESDKYYSFCCYPTCLFKMNISRCICYTCLAVMASGGGGR